MNNELIGKAKQAKSAEALLALAKENGVELSEQEANEYFTKLGKSGELSDDELDNVSGGGCYRNDGRLVVTMGYGCDNFLCIHCGRKYSETHVCGHDRRIIHRNCDSCKFCTYEKGLWLCNHENNMK